mgnify:CR=1 FL=1
MKKIVLFDMDGTLTPAREPLDPNLIGPLKVLSYFSYIGVVTGSDYDYLKHQLRFLLENSRIRYKLHLFPCNGTKHYKPPIYNHQGFTLVKSVSMKDEIGDKLFNRMMKILVDYQNHISSHFEIPLTGHFISYRGSTINWSPIGRNATQEEREKFINFDKGFSNSNFREIVAEQLRAEFKNINLDTIVKIGGDTSFDIFPRGWDKTYVFNHLEGYEKWFVGDRCHEGGNDEEIYKALLPNNSFSVETPKQTKEVIEEILIPTFKKEQ